MTYETTQTKLRIFVDFCIGFGIIIVSNYMYWGNSMMKYRFSKEIYSKEALLKSAYRFTDIAYLHLDTDEEYYYVTIELKNTNTSISEQEFQNALLAEMVRLCVSHQTKNVRELILARAFSSTIIEEVPIEQPPDNDYNINEILTDWFDKYDNDKTEQGIV